MRQKKTITLVMWFLMFGTIAYASSIIHLSNLTLGNSLTEKKSIVLTSSENLPLQEHHGFTSSTPRTTLEEDDDDTAKEKILTTTTFVRYDFHQRFHFKQNVFETLDLEILTPPPQE